MFAAFLLVTVVICGCGLFEPRTPEPPGVSGTPWTPTTAPEIVLDNLVNSMKDKVIANYMQNISTDTTTVAFAFHPDPADSFDLSSTRPGVYDNWTREVERQATQSIFDEAASLTLTFQKRDSTVFVGTDQCVFYYTYLLQATYKTGATEYLAGLVEFHLRLEGSYWYLFLWIDKRDPNFPLLRTWGNLKGTKRILG